MDKKYTPADKAMLIPLLEEKLERMKAVKPHTDTKLAHTAYKKELVRMLKKINPKGWYYVN